MRTEYCSISEVTFRLLFYDNQALLSWKVQPQYSVVFQLEPGKYNHTILLQFVPRKYSHIIAFQFVPTKYNHTIVVQFEPGKYNRIVVFQFESWHLPPSILERFGNLIGCPTDLALHPLESLSVFCRAGKFNLYFLLYIIC